MIGQEPKTKVKTLAHALFLEHRVQMIRNEPSSSYYRMMYDATGCGHERLCNSL